MPNQLLDDNSELPNSSKEKQLEQARMLCYGLLALCFVGFVVFQELYYEETHRISIRYPLSKGNKSGGDILMFLYAFYIWTFLGAGFLILSTFNQVINNKIVIYFSNFIKDFGLNTKIAIFKWLGVFFISFLLIAVLMNVLLALMFGIISGVKFLIWLVAGIDLGYSRLQKIEISRYPVVAMVFYFIYFQIKKTFILLEKEEI